MSTPKILIFDTTLRDGELMSGVRFNCAQKLEISRSLENIGVDIIEVGYPNQNAKDFEEVVAVAKHLQKATICALSEAKEKELLQTIEAIKDAKKGRIHLYANVNVPDRIRQEQTLEIIKSSITFARNYCQDIEWTAFDATRSEIDFLCQTVEIAIASGAKTINIADSLGVAKPEEFSQLIQTVINRVPNSDRCIISVHCHEDLGFAVANSLVALEAGARQIECATNGLGARKGNADLAGIIKGIEKSDRFYASIASPLLPNVSELVRRSVAENQ